MQNVSEVFFAVNRLLEDAQYATMMFTQYIPTFRVAFRRYLGDINLLKELYQIMIIIIIVISTHLSLLGLGNIWKNNPLWQSCVKIFLAYFEQVFSHYNPWKHQKMRYLLIILWCKGRENWPELVKCYDISQKFDHHFDFCIATFFGWYHADSFIVLFI